MNVSDVQDVRDVHAPVGRLLARTRREWTSDVLLTLLVMATVVLRSDVPPVSDTAAAIEMFLVLPLVLRRVFPSTVFVVLLVLFGTLPLWSTVSGRTWPYWWPSTQWRPTSPGSGPVSRRWPWTSPTWCW